MDTNDKYIGKMLDDRYEILEVIGEGGMAIVYRALDHRLNRDVAVKIMRDEMAADEEFRRRFCTESHAVAMLSHPNIVAVYDVSHNDNVEYIVMELVDGITLKQYIERKGVVAWKEVVHFTKQISKALAHAHERGIIHRDIKPQNIMLLRDGTIKVGDFGIAALENEVYENNGEAIGSIHYIAPEQARGETVDMRSDLYSAGCVLYEMLTGRPPFTGDSAVAIAYQHVSEVATPPSSVVPGLPKMWDSICAKAMAKDRQNRYATASEFKNDMLTFMNGGVPVAAAFNPLTDLTNVKARKQAEQEAATVAMNPTSGESAATQAFNPVTGQFEQVLAGPNGGVATKTRAEQRAAAAKSKKKKQIIIGSVVGVLVALLAILGIVYMLNHGDSSTDTVEVPDFTEMSNISQTTVEEKLNALGLKLDARDDTESDQTKGTVTKQNPKGGSKVEKGSTVSVWFSTGPQTVSVPDVANKGQEEAKSILESAGFKVGSVKTVDSGTVEKDKVVSTDPAANSKQTKGTIITLYISSGMTKIPDNLVGQSKDSVIEQLNKAGIGTVNVENEYSDSVDSGSVTRLDPGSGSTVELGTSVTIWVSLGKQQVSVPSVLHMTLSSAKSVLTNNGFQVTVNGSTDDDAIVTGMSPEGGSQADSGATITLTTESASSPSPSPSGSTSSSTASPTTH